MYLSLFQFSEAQAKGKYIRGQARAGASPLFWVKQEEMTEGGKAAWASNIERGPLFSSKSGSATGLKGHPWVFRSVET